MGQQPVELGVDDRVGAGVGGEPGEVHLERLPARVLQVGGVNVLEDGGAQVGGLGDGPDPGGDDREQGVGVYLDVAVDPRGGITDGSVGGDGDDVGHQRGDDLVEQADRDRSDLAAVAAAGHERGERLLPGLGESQQVESALPRNVRADAVGSLLEIFIAGDQFIVL